MVDLAAPGYCAWRTSRSNVALLCFMMAAYMLILMLFTTYTNNLDEIKPTLQFMLLPLGWLAFFFMLWRGEAAPIPKSVWAPLAGFGVVSLLSTLMAFQPWRAWFVNGWYYTIVIPLFILPACIKSESILRRILIAYVAVGLAIILFGFFHYCGGVRFLMNGFWPIPPLGRSRLYDLSFTLASSHEMFSTILSAPFYGGYLALLVPMALSLALAPSRRGWEATLGLVTALLACIAIYLTNSLSARGAAILAVLFYCAMILVIKGALPRKFAAMLICGIGVLAVLFLVILYIKPTPWQSYVNHHAILSQCALDIFRAKPSAIPGYTPHALTQLIGAGPGGYHVLSPFYIKDNYFENCLANVNIFSFNMYLDILCEQGLLGLLCYVAFLAAIVRLGMRQIFRPGSAFLRMQQAGLMAAVLGRIFKDAVSGADSRWTASGLNNWMIFGLAVSCAMLGMREEELAGQSSATAAGAAPEPPQPLSESEMPNVSQPEPLEKAPSDASDPSDPSDKSEPSDKPNPSGNLAGFASMSATAMIAIYLCIFGVRYFASAYYNNEGIISIQYAAGGTSLASSSKSYEQAVRYFDKSLQCWPGFITGYYKQAHAYSMLGRYEDAVKTYDRLSQRAPGYSETWFNYGIVYGVIARKAQKPDEISKYLRLSLENFEKALAFGKKLNVAQSVVQAYQFAAQRQPGITDAERKQWMKRSYEILYQTCMRPYPLEEDSEPHKALRKESSRYLWSAATQADRDKDDKLAAQYAAWTVEVCSKIIIEDGNSDPAIVHLKEEASAERRSKPAPQ
ncbi:MAG: hypothetical protein NTX50_30720 [Candidatus Sumerlaeota bacterium]|nr:hypothetical protein [Candidatus Sumerlaeota bacterium]